MSFTDKYDLEEISYGVTGWNAIVTSNNQKIDEAVKSRLPAGTAGEALSAFEAVYLAADGRFYKASASASGRFPCRGLAIEAASSGSQVRVQRDGDLSNPSWSLIAGGDVFLSPAVDGGLTQVEPAGNAQRIGYALAADTIVIQLEAVQNVSTTSTTTTTT